MTMIDQGELPSDDSLCYSAQQLWELSKSPQAELRKFALSTIRHQIEYCQYQERFQLDIARSLISDEDNDCRWQALIVVGEWLKTDPELIWTIILEHGNSHDSDMRSAVATILLEHLLEHYFDTYFSRLCHAIHAGSKNLSDTLRRCSAFGNARDRWQDVEAFLSTLDRT